MDGRLEYQRTTGSKRYADHNIVSTCSNSGLPVSNVASHLHIAEIFLPRHRIRILFHFIATLDRQWKRL